MPIILPGFQQVYLVNIRFITQAGKFGETQAASQGDIEDRGTQSSRLRHEGHRAGRRSTRCERSVDRRIGIDYTQAIWADQTDMVLPGDTDQLQLAFKAFLTRLAKASADHDGCRDALLTAFFQYVRYLRVWDD